jgi:hypothetical protein
LAKATHDAIESADKRRTQKLGGVAENKYLQQDDLANQATAIASAIGTYALLKKDMALKEAMNFSKSELYYGSSQELSAKCANILATAKGLGAELKEFGITDSMLTLFGTVLAQYDDAKNKPRNVVAERKVARHQVAELLKQLHVIFTEQVDALMLLFKFTHAEFYNEYRAKRLLVSPGHRKTRVEGVVTDKRTNASLHNVTVSVKGVDNSASTAQDGSYSLQTVPLPAATLVFEKEGYKPLTIETGIKRGKVMVQDIALETI